MKFKSLPLLSFLLLLAPRAFASALLKPTTGETQQLSAKSLDVRARIEGAFARATLTTTYQNLNSRRIEADFIYAAPEGSVVTGFAYWFGGEKVTARVVEKRRAARIYSYITTRQRDPALVEMIGKNSFRARIFPIEANQDLKIEVQLAQHLDETRDGFVWRYPLREETAAPLEKLSVHVETPGARANSNLGNFSADKLDFERENAAKSDDLQVFLPRYPTPLRASLLARREAENGDGFFALSLASASAVALPRLKISGVSTYDVLAPDVRSLKAFEPFVVFGRYRKGGAAVVALNGQSVALNFGSQIEEHSAAASLWAQTRIETLSQSPKNEFAVVNLSKRFGLVSKWTSWLAIPATERARFQREVDAADRANAGRAYAQAIARNDRITAAAQHTIYARLTQKLGETEPISNYLDAELELVSRSIEIAKTDVSQRKDLANWRQLQRVLIKNGAHRDSDDYAARERAYAEAGKLAPLYVAAIESRDAEGAKRLKNRLSALANSRAVRRNDERVGFDDRVAQEAYRRSAELARLVALERGENRLSATRERDLNARLERIHPLFGFGYNQKTAEILRDGQTRVVDEKTAAAREKAANSITFGAPLEEATRDFEVQRQAWEKRVGGQDLPSYPAKSAFKTAIENRLDTEVRAGRELEPQNVQLERDFETLQKQTNDPNSWKLREAYADRARETAQQLLLEQMQNGADSSRAQTLQSEVARLAAKSGNRNDNYLLAAAGKVRGDAKTQIANEVAKYAETSPAAQEAQQTLDKLAALDPHYTEVDRQYYYGSQGDYDLSQAWHGRAHESAYRLLEAQEKTPSDASEIARLQADLQREAAQTKTGAQEFTDWEKMRRAQGEALLTAQNYRVRWGDPLIAVLAPANCRKVVALMPDGAFLPLAFDAAKGAWEARFDVPMWAGEGDYRVQIIVVSADGTRQHLTMNFALDVSAPKGVAGVQNAGKTWVLTLQSDEMSDRVTAITPWNERIELRRNEDGIFSAPVAVPDAFSNRESAVRFIVTDKAHNRTEILVDLRP